MMTQPVELPSETAKNGDSRGPHGPIVHGSVSLEPAPRPPEAAGPRPDFATESRSGRVWQWVLIIAIATSGWYYRDRWLPFVAPGWAKSSAAPTKGGGIKAIPVRTAEVQQRDMPVFIKGLGTVTAFKTVTLRSRVDGELIKVAFTEGQMVREGDLLAEIDPRPFQSMLDQAQGTLAKDQATLELAKITLQRARELLKRNSISQQEVDQDAAQVQTIEGTVQTDQALVATAKLQLTYCRIVYDPSVDESD